MKKMRTRILRAIVLSSFIAILSTLAIVIGFSYDFILDTELDDLKNTAHSMASAVEKEGVSFLETVNYETVRLTLISSQGEILFDDTADSNTMENHADREEIRAAIDKGEASVLRYSQTLSKYTLYYALLLDNGCVFRVSVTRSSIFSLLVLLIQPIVIVFLVVILISVFLASRLAKSVVKPINEIDLELPEKAKTYEELAPLISRLVSQKEQIKAQIKELARRQAEFTAITENMSEGLLVVGNKTELLSYNASAMKLLGADFSHKYKDSVFAINRSDAFRRAVTKAISGTPCEEMLYAFGRCYQILANPVKDREKVHGAVLLILDVTEREERDSLRREFTANVSHELKTPLTSISGFAEIIRNGLVKAEDIPEFASNICDEAQRLISLVGDIIKLSRLDENSVALDSEHIDLFELCEDITKRLSTASAKKGISVNISGQHKTITSVRAVVDEMIYNLVDNAVKYNKEKGSVDIFITSNAQNQPVLRISDTGIGIPMTDKERVFERFYRVNKSHSKEIGGTGLGLSIVKHAASFLGAEIELQSDLDVGTTVTVTFPFSENA